MKIMVISSHTPSLMWFRLDMMIAFIQSGCEVVAVGNEDASNWASQFKEHNIKYRQAFIDRNGTNPFKDIKTFNSFKKIILEEKPDKVFVYNAKAVVYGGIAAHKAKIDTFPLIAGLGSVFMQKGFKASLVRTILINQYKKSLKHCKKVFFQNNDDVNDFINYGIIKREQATLLHGSGVNLNNFIVQELPSNFGFLFIGRLIKDKGVFEYLEASKLVKEKYPNVRCLLVGPFDSNPSAMKKEDLQPFLDSGVVEYFGEQKDVRPYLAQCNVFVLPSYREGTPKTVLEAMACYKAVITTDAPGCKETVIDGKNGFLVPIKNVNALAEKMIVLVENRELVNEMAKNGRKMAEDIFDVNKINETIIKEMDIKSSGDKL